ncbi:MAG TPA: replication-relaxation family protein [Solirubrobacterales bacterium]|nr:replication-relaxation family protein [Solirubrobacterales bacterium]
MSGARRSTRRRPARGPALSDLDLRILSLLSRHRVVTQTQLAAICPEVPIRTLRYRCSQLAGAGLLGRTRPYRERGSAPNHLWPTRNGEATACGGPPPRGGERREPNPLFLTHAAGLTEVWVTLETTLRDGVRLARFEREADAREPFAVPATRSERAIAPDALVEITDTDGRALLAFVELDMGTMSHRRLRQKATGYGDYAKAEAWREYHRFCPALLFITTTAARARSFLAAMHKEAGKDSLLLTCACDLARRPHRIAEGPRWLHDPEKDHAVNLLAVLREARRPFDEEREREEAEHRKEEAERKRLRSDPEALRDHLRRWWGSEPRLGDLEEVSAGALAITLGRTDPMAEAERRALLALAAMIGDPLRPLPPDELPTARQRRAFADLAGHHRDEQLGRIADLALRHGDGPALRRARRQVEGGDLLPSSETSWLEQKAVEDERSREEQERLTTSYLAWRETEARRLVKAQGIVARLGTRPEDFFGDIDRRSLRRCPGCGEIAYPDPERASGHATRHVAERCHFCGGTALAEIGGEARS